MFTLSTTTTHNALTSFDNATIDALQRILVEQHNAIASKVDRRTGKRSAMAKNYDSAIRALGEYMMTINATLPDYTTLEQWRDDMLTGANGQTSRNGKPYARSTINARLSAVRKLINNTAKAVNDVSMKATLRDWASIEDAKADSQKSDDDKVESDYGLRLTIAEVETMMQSFDTSNLQGLRDSALVALMVGSGLRVSETVKLTMRDVFLTTNDKGQRAINIAKSKHGKARVVPVGRDSWVLKTVQAYTDAIGLTPMTNPDSKVFYGLTRTKGNGYTSNDTPLSTRGAIRAVERVQVEPHGNICAHDLRRTYAKICKDNGMSWEALRDNLGHASVVTTERYVGKTSDWKKRQPNWHVNI